MGFLKIFVMLGVGSCKRLTENINTLYNAFLGGKLISK